MSAGMHARGWMGDYWALPPQATETRPATWAGLRVDVRRYRFKRHRHRCDDQVRAFLLEVDLATGKPSRGWLDEIDTLRAHRFPRRAL